MASVTGLASGPRTVPLSDASGAGCDSAVAVRRLIPTNRIAICVRVPGARGEIVLRGCKKAVSSKERLHRILAVPCAGDNARYDRVLKTNLEIAGARNHAGNRMHCFVADPNKMRTRRISSLLWIL